MSYKFRKDNRSDEQFAEDIRRAHLIEHVWAMALQADFGDRGQPCEIECNGVDCDGTVIDGVIGHHAADWKFVFDGGDLLIEVKTIPEWCKDFCTFKLSSLKACAKEGAYIIVPRRESYCLYSPEACERLIKFPARIYRGFSPNDLAVRFYSSTTAELIGDGLVDCKSWQASARRLVDRNSKLLFSQGES